MKFCLQSLRDWKAEVIWLAQLQDTHLCKLIGHSAEDVSGPQNRRLLVYELMNNGTLDLYIKSVKSPLLDWPARMRIALDVFQGLAYLHDKAAFQVTAFVVIYLLLKAVSQLF
jgi:serine/threonine protein kinase